jgi:hypothetical protein
MEKRVRHRQPKGAETDGLLLHTTAPVPDPTFWPQNYITDGIAGNVQYDDTVVATRRVGCLQQ